jgi:hypothetical protein
MTAALNQFIPDIPIVETSKEKEELRCVRISLPDSMI